MSQEQSEGVKVDRDEVVHLLPAFTPTCSGQTIRQTSCCLSVCLSVCLSSSLLQLLFVFLQLRHEAGVRIDHMTSRLHFLGTETSVKLQNVSLDVKKNMQLIGEEISTIQSDFRS